MFSIPRRRWQCQCTAGRRAVRRSPPTHQRATYNSPNYPIKSIIKTNLNNNNNRNSNDVNKLANLRDRQRRNRQRPHHRRRRAHRSTPLPITIDRDTSIPQYFHLSFRLDYRQQLALIFIQHTYCSLQCVPLLFRFQALHTMLPIVYNNIINKNHNTALYISNLTVQKVTALIMTIELSQSNHSLNLSYIERIIMFNI
jgi:hypothetical protein